jgi:hypothetical protein
LLAVMMYIISFYIILSTDIHSNSCRWSMLDYNIVRLCYCMLTHIQ